MRPPLYWNKFYLYSMKKIAIFSFCISTWLACGVKDPNKKIMRKAKAVDSMATPGIKESAKIADLNSFESKGAEVLYRLITEKGETYFTQHAFDELEKQGLSTSDDLFFLEAGQRLISEKKFQAALVLYQLFTSEFSHTVIAWNDLGQVYLELKETEKARTCFEKALQLQPDNARAKRMLEQMKGA